MREVSQLSPQQLAGQLLVVGFEGTELPEDIRRSLAETALGGVILFERNLPSLSAAWALCKQVTELVDPNFAPFIGVDQEGGRVRRMKREVVAAPSMRALGAHDPSLTQQVAAAVAQELVAIGFSINFAPVLDVDSNPKNPVIGDRAFSADPKVVTAHGAAVIEGFESRGLMACAKHFPGHGDTNADSHVTLPSVSRSSVELRSVELYPFERLARRCPAVMTAHVIFESFDSVPATLSPRLLGLLRKEFAFEGVIFSDDLEMGALSNRSKIEDSAVAAIRAGCDSLLVCRRSEARNRALAGLRQQIESDAAFRTRCEQAVARNLTQRRRFPPRPAESFAGVSAALASEAGILVRKRLKKLSA